MGVDTEAAAVSPDVATRAAQVLDLLVAHVHETPSDDRVWLLLTAVSGAFPTAEEVDSGRRTFELSGPSDCALWLLEEGFTMACAAGSPLSRLTVVTDQVVADVDFCARHDLHTGIQRVVREVIPRWQDERAPRLVAWTSGFGAMRALTERERSRVLSFSHPQRRPTVSKVPSSPPELIVPWRTVVFLPEVPGPQQSPRLMALARYSGNDVVAIGYDCIPVVDADMLSPEEPTKFVQYLAVVKYARRVVAISATAAREFAGFVSMLPTQGLAGPDVRGCELPVEVPADPAADEVRAHQLPVVLVVGSHDPRKNHLAVLHAAERLWREGHRFELRLIGGKGWRTEPFDRALSRLRRTGRPIRADRSVGDAGLWTAYRSARFTVFPSLHEGYGLPVAESLACDTPVITSNYGSTAEILAGGGGIAVDPRNDDQLTDAMRSLLADDALLERLRREARTRAARTWDDYARELRTLVEGVR